VIGVGVGLVVLTLYRARLDTLASALKRFDRTAATAGTTDSGAVRTGFREVRLAYKRVEWLVEYVDLASAAALNGPGVEGVDETEDDPGEPDEESSLGLLRGAEATVYRFPVLFASTRAKLAAEIGGARMVVERLRVAADTVRLSDADIDRAARREMIRIVALGLAGEDSRVARESLAEARAALGAMQGVGVVGDSMLGVALALVGDASSFETFNRLRFIVAVARPLGLFARPTVRAPPPSLVASGAKLFRDPTLSGSKGRACAGCHQPARGFTDGLARAAPLPSHPGAVLRHTPTLLNVALADAWFDDGRASSLERQAEIVVTNPVEMGGRPISPRVAHALAAYERTLVGFNSRVDRALAGDTLALTSGERHGFNLFMGKAACGTCHYFPLFSGMRPPLYTHTDFEVLGVPTRADTVGVRVDPDSGRARVTHDPTDVGAMKTPGLRFVVPGGPYMHNGVYRSLAEVVDFYDRGGQRLANQTLSPAPLHLTDAEKRDLTAFLEALRDSVGPGP
jgi:cytochrome c peroxidase